MVWDRVPKLKKSIAPAPLLVVIFSVGLGWLLSKLGGNWQITAQQLVSVPVAGNLRDYFGLIRTPDFTQWTNASIYTGGATIAVVASLETLLNLEAVDKLDRKHRSSPPNQELIAQGIGNVTAGMLGGIPVTSVVIRGSVNVNSGAVTKLATIFHGVLLLACAVLIPYALMMIPLSCLAAILIATGFKLANPMLIIHSVQQGRSQAIPFLLTLVVIVFTDLLMGVFVGLLTSFFFVINKDRKRRFPINCIQDSSGEVLCLELSDRNSFLNKSSIKSALNEVPAGASLWIDATKTTSVDPDILDAIRDFQLHSAPSRDIAIRMIGFPLK